MTEQDKKTLDLINKIIEKQEAQEKAIKSLAFGYDGLSKVVSTIIVVLSHVYNLFITSGIDKKIKDKSSLNNIHNLLDKLTKVLQNEETPKTPSSGG